FNQNILLFQPSLLKAIFNVDPDEVRSLIFKKEDVNVQDNEKRTPLHAAAYLGDAEIIELLILSGARVNAKDNKWLTPLHRAVASCSEVGKPFSFTSDTLPYTVNPLIKAGIQLKMVRLLLSRGANINAFDKKDRRAIHWAAYMGHIEVVKLLASHRAEVACKDKKSYTPLHAAASSGMISVVKYFLDLGVDINEPNAYGNTPLHVACYNGQDVVVNELIESGANVNQVNEKGFAPLHFTAASRHGALCLELLVCNGADVNIKSKDGKTPLHMTAIHGRFSRSQAIIENGAEIDCEDKNGNTPLHIAARYGHELLINTLITNKADTAKRGIHGMFPLHLAALSGFSDCCRKLLSSVRCCPLSSCDVVDNSSLCAGFDIDTPDDFGRTYHICTAASDTDGKSRNSDNLRSMCEQPESKRDCCVFRCLEYLLRNDANPGIRDNQGYNTVHYASAYGHRLCLELVRNTCTDILNDSDVWAPVSPLHLAAYHGHHQAMEVLVQSLLDLDVRNQEGRTPLDLAAFKGHVECVDVLINQGASIFVKDSTLKRTPIHAAATNGHSECLRLLIGNSDLQSALDIQDGKGQTPLMLSVLSGHIECVYSLLNKGANVEAKDKLGRTALHRGAVTGHEECVEALLQHSTNFLAQDCKGRTPIHLAAACGHIGVLGGLLHAAQSVETLPILTDREGYTPLHWACYNGHDTCVEVLLEQEIFQKAEGNPFSPLHCAVFRDNESAAEMLIDTLGRVIVNAKDSKNRTPLHAAAFADHVECLQLLLSHNAQVNCADAAGKTPLMMAAENGQNNAVELLVSSAKADLTLQDALKNTALHLACRKGHETSALMILEKITDRNLINATNAALQTPLHVAARNGLIVVVQELLAKGASVLAVDENGYTPALACAPNKDVADCLALILSTMIPVSPCTPAPPHPFRLGKAGRKGSPHGSNKCPCWPTPIPTSSGTRRPLAETGCR
uniref:Ankyrin repeat domain 28 n=1 Tax=Nothobranchius furzeri TaxID=105023 RepID=A0A8C6KED5_NOTFU